MGINIHINKQDAAKPQTTGITCTLSLRWRYNLLGESFPLEAASAYVRKARHRYVGRGPTFLVSQKASRSHDEIIRLLTCLFKDVLISQKTNLSIHSLVKENEQE